MAQLETVLAKHHPQVWPAVRDAWQWLETDAGSDAQITDRLRGLRAGFERILHQSGKEQFTPTVSQQAWQAVLETLLSCKDWQRSSGWFSQRRYHGTDACWTVSCEPDDLRLQKHETKTMRFAYQAGNCLPAPHPANQHHPPCPYPPAARQQLRGLIVHVSRPCTSNAEDAFPFECADVGVARRFTWRSQSVPSARFSFCLSKWWSGATVQTAESLMLSQSPPHYGIECVLELEADCVLRSEQRLVLVASLLVKMQDLMDLALGPNCGLPVLPVLLPLGAS